MIPAELLRKKRDGHELSAQEIQEFIAGLLSLQVTEAQAAAFLMAACTRGLSPRETAALSIAMRDSGTRYDFHDLGGTIIDKHSTGGVGDKLSLLLVPIVAACGVKVPMMSGRGLGHTGGTVDKLESIPGLRMDFDESVLRELLRKHGAFLIKATANVAPADGVLYALRDVTGTIESTSLITASILSKKLTEGLDALVLDMKVGRGAFMQTREQADELAQSMLMVSREAGLRMRIVFTNMDHPLGTTVGNWLEMQETDEALSDYHNCSADTRELSEVLASQMLMLADSALSSEQALSQVRDAWQSGRAHKLFHELLQSQGGTWEEAQSKYSELHTMVLRSPQDGILHSWATREMGLAGIELGAGRKRQQDSIDAAAGFRLLKRVGDEVRKGDELLILQASRPEKLQVVHDMLLQGLEIHRDEFIAKPMVLDII